MVYKIAVCDDEWGAVNQISTYLNQIQQECEYAFQPFYYNSGEELLENLTNDLSIIILDIQMGNISGMDVAHIIREKGIDAYLFFVTSKIEYAIEGYEVHAYSFFRKPLNYSTFKRNILEVCDKMNEQNTVNKIQLSGDTKDTYNIDEIIYVEVLRHTTTIHTANGTKDYNNEPISKLEEQLIKDHFFRCHKSYLVNLSHILNYNIDTITLDNNDEIPLSKYRKKEFREAYTLYLGMQL